ncbi:hypothetical protein B0H15DRAFT_1024542 [Mycena belliarum]|uniref:Uncharacterized protein n=1 Tax=Mycena belliarum TaxID=1033014 RepID=A0AAD6TWY8_9AGAR|nr:hypothetical protein B0H15DRAFT_1024542 [Mycena belliae]
MSHEADMISTCNATTPERTIAPSEHGPDSDDVGTKKPGFPASWLVSSDEDIIADAEWHRDPTGIPDYFTVDWAQFPGKFSFRTGKNKDGEVTRPAYAMGPIRRCGITGPVVPICSVGHTDSYLYILLFTTAGPAEDGKKTFYDILYHQECRAHRQEDTTGTRVRRYKGSFDSVASFFDGEDVIEREAEDLEELEG